MSLYGTDERQVSARWWPGTEMFPDSLGMVVGRVAQAAGLFHGSAIRQARECLRYLREPGPMPRTLVSTL